MAWREESIGATSRGKRRFSKIFWWAPGEKKSVGATSQGYGAWGSGSQGLEAQGFSRGLGPGPSQRIVLWCARLRPPPPEQDYTLRRSEKSLGGRQAKGWETAETAAAEVGVLTPCPPPLSRL